MKGALNASKSLLDGQHLPEGDKIDDAVSNIGDCLAKVGDLSGKLATNLDNFADQACIRTSHPVTGGIGYRIRSWTLATVSHFPSIGISPTIQSTLQRSTRTSPS